MIVTNRRAFVRGGAGAALLAAGGCAHRPSNGSPRLGIADITVHRELQTDYQGTVAALRSIGFTHLGSRQRRWGPQDREEPTAVEKARIFRAEGMLPGPARLVPNVPLDQAIDETRIFGADILVMSAGAIFHDRGNPRTPTQQELDAFIQELNVTGARCREAGVKFAYHNHDFDTVVIGGKRGLDRMIDETDPQNVFFEIDLAWLHVGGDDPIAMLTRLGERVVSLHLKDYDPSRGDTELARMAVPGDGEMNYADLLPRLWPVTSALPLLEVEGAGGASVGMDAARRGYAFIAPTMAS